MRTSEPQSARIGELETEIAELKARLWEAEEIVAAIRNGEVDAVVVGTNAPSAVYTFFGADHPYRVLVEGMREGAVTIARDGTILYANPSFGRIVGRSLSSIFGSSFGGYVAPNDASMFQAFLQQEREGKAEVSLVNADGTKVPVYLSRSAADLVGTHGIAMVVTDLAEQKRNEEIVASGRLANLILDQATEAIVVCDASGRITRANRKAASLAGCNPLLQQFTEAFPLVISDQQTDREPEDHDVEGMIGIAEVARGERTAEIWEATLPNAGGHPIFLQLSGGPLRSDDDVLGAVIVMADITLARNSAESLRKSEARLRSLNATLEERVTSRTRELEDANYLLSQKNRELQEFAYVASHDLQEPLRKVQTFASLLRSEYGDALDEEAQGFFERMEDAAQRMSKLISDLLSLSRITTRGKRFEPVDLNEVLKHVLEDLEVLLDEKGATVEVDSLPLIVADPTQMRQLFQNLISNAVLFQEPPSCPSVRVINGAESNANVCTVHVEDNGIGFDPQYVDRIFTPFQRLHGRSTYPGTGMGLAICHRIVERHGGSIHAASSIGQGSVFSVTMPLHQQEERDGPVADGEAES